MPDARIIEGKLQDVLPTLEAESFESVVTDPPYELLAASRNGSRRINEPDNPYGRHGSRGGFMGMKWDATGVAFEVATWQAVMRVLKPGGHLVASGGTRTFHRMMVAIEDAGFEMRDSIGNLALLGWLYGQGFPKSHNLDGEWEGWGSALKPSWEPIVLARKPLGEPSIEANMVRHHTGAINIDGCRIEGIPDKPGSTPPSSVDGRRNSMAGPMDRVEYDNTRGRWPANVVLDEAAAAELDRQAGERGGASPTTGDEPSPVTNGIYGKFAQRLPGTFYDDQGGPSRFFYTAKASRSERDERVRSDAKPMLWSSGTQNPGTFQSPNTNRSARNHHATVKPISLMRWLCRLITPPGGTILDPFAGSGTTLIAAMMEGFSAVGIEKESEYAEIAKQRIDGVQTGMF